MPNVCTKFHLQGSAMFRLYGVKMPVGAGVPMETEVAAPPLQSAEPAEAAKTDIISMAVEEESVKENSKMVAEEVVPVKDIDRTPILFDPSSVQEKDSG